MQTAVASVDLDACDGWRDRGKPQLAAIELVGPRRQPAGKGSWKLYSRPAPPIPLSCPHVLNSIDLDGMGSPAHVLDGYYLAITILVTVGYQLSGFAIAWTLQVCCRTSCI